MDNRWTIDGAVAEEEWRKSEGRAKDQRNYKYSPFIFFISLIHDGNYKIC